MHCTPEIYSQDFSEEISAVHGFQRNGNTVRREISFGETFCIKKTFKNRWSAGLNICGGGIEKGSDKLCDISAKSAGRENKLSSN